MDTFPKLVYKSHEYQRRRPVEVTQEQLDYSKKIAREKLGKIMDPRFKKFAVRYMNIEEYREMLETGQFGGRGGEATLHGVVDRGVGSASFAQFLKYASGEADTYSNWSTLNDAQQRMARIVRIVATIERQEKEVPKKEKLDRIREEIMDLIEGEAFESWIYFHGDAQMKLSGMNLSESQHARLLKVRDEIHAGVIHTEDELRNELQLPKDQTEELRMYIGACENERVFGAETVKTLLHLRDDPAYMQQPGALRAVANAFAYAIDKRSKEQGSWSMGRQYEIAAIFDSELLRLRPMRENKHGAKWAGIGGQGHDGKKEALLAAISIMPLKDLYKEMVELEKGSGDFAHPIFDVNGSQRWPA